MEICPNCGQILETLETSEGQFKFCKDCKARHEKKMFTLKRTFRQREH